MRLRMQLTAAGVPYFEVERVTLIEIDQMERVAYEDQLKSDGVRPSDIDVAKKFARDRGLKTDF